MVAPQIRQGDILADRGVEANLYTQIERSWISRLIASIDAIHGHAVTDHAARLGTGFINRDIMTQQSQVVCHRQPGRTCADNGDAATLATGLRAQGTQLFIDQRAGE